MSQAKRGPSFLTNALLQHPPILDKARLPELQEHIQWWVPFCWRLMRVSRVVTLSLCPHRTKRGVDVSVSQNNARPLIFPSMIKWLLSSEMTYACLQVEKVKCLKLSVRYLLLQTYLFCDSTSKLLKLKVVLWLWENGACVILSPLR